MRRFYFCYAGAIVSTALIPPVFLFLLFGEWFYRELFGAFLLTLVHGSLVFYVNARAIREEHTRFLHWGLGIHGARVIVLLSIIMLLYGMRMENLLPFIAATLTGYFCFLFFEILGLYQGMIRTN